MSSAAGADEKVCANCGIAEGDDIKLEDCGGCDLVKYCNGGCRELHRPEHFGECKKRVKELHERKLFEQPDETHLGECPLCFLPLPIDRSKSMFWSCCSSVICKGCDYSNDISGGGDRCPFCREKVFDEEEFEKRLMKRVKANDPAAMTHMGGELIQQGDYDGAFKYLTKAAELGDADAHYRLGIMYRLGHGVEKDVVKEVYHYEKAAIGGHPTARHELARNEEGNGKIEKAVKHHMIAAKLGFEQSMKALWERYSAGDITKEDLETTLRSHQAALDEMKSEQRDAGERYFRRWV